MVVLPIPPIPQIPTMQTLFKSMFIKDLSFSKRIFIPTMFSPTYKLLGFNLVMMLLVISSITTDSDLPMIKYNKTRLELEAAARDKKIKNKTVK